MVSITHKTCSFILKKQPNQKTTSKKPNPNQKKTNPTQRYSEHVFKDLLE